MITSAPTRTIKRLEEGAVGVTPPWALLYDNTDTQHYFWLHGDYPAKHAPEQPSDTLRVARWQGALYVYWSVACDHWGSFTQLAPFPGVGRWRWALPVERVYLDDTIQQADPALRQLLKGA
jgi:hypothetical protein